MGQDRKHPPGLYFLFFTEMWERFGFYLMLGIFTLYMIAPATASDPAKAGLGLSDGRAADIMGTYIALVYLTPFLGGLLADRYIGYRVSIFIGGVLMALGYLGLSLPGWPAFWGSLLLIILGNGLFKPNISTLLGNLYSEDRYRPYKDAGYNIFYMGINIGAFICNFVAAYLRTQYGWGYAFAAGGVGMLIGLAVFAFGQGRVKAGDVASPRAGRHAPAPHHRLGLCSGGALWHHRLVRALRAASSSDPFQVLGRFSLRVHPGPRVLRLPVVAGARRGQAGGRGFLAIFAVVIVFWAIFNQAGTALTFWAERYTDRTLPAALGPLAKDLGAVQVVTPNPKRGPNSTRSSAQQR